MRGRRPPVPIVEAAHEVEAETAPALATGAHAPRVAFVGLSCRDHIWQVERFPPERSRTDATAYRAHGGGPAATAAVAAARLGAEVFLWAIHGDDDDGESCRAELVTEGVDVRGVRTTLGSRSFVSAVLVTPTGERFIFPYRGDALLDDPRGHDWSPLGDAAALLVDGRHPALTAHALDLAERARVPTIGDWGDPREWHLAERVDHLIVSEECARAVSGEDPVAALRTLRTRPGQTVAVTLGPRGVVWDAGDGPRALPAPPVDGVVDTNGAGDAFHGGYAVAIAQGAEVGDAMRLASAVAALKCRGHGRATLPDRLEAQELAARLDPDVAA